MDIEEKASAIAASIVFAVIVFFIGCWIANVVKFLDCDFKADYTCEAIHAIGLIPPASIVTVWFDTDK